MRDGVPRSIEANNQAEGSCRLVRQSEGVFAGPGSNALAAIVLRGNQLVIAAKLLTESAPLARAGARAMERDHQSTAAWLRCRNSIRRHETSTPSRQEKTDPVFGNDQSMPRSKRSEFQRAHAFGCGTMPPSAPTARLRGKKSPN